MPIIRPSGNVIIAGRAFPTEARVVNFTEYPYWDASSTECKPTVTNPAPQCKPVPGAPNKHIPYGVGAHDNRAVLRYSTRPALRRADWKMGMNAPYDAVKNVIKQFVIHHDGCATADMCWNVLQNERGLSVHFLCDNDGTIYQTLDLALMGYHASAWNPWSIGVELCSRGDAKSSPNFYRSGKYGPDRDRVPAKINGHTYLAFDYTKEQYAEMKKLSRALLRILPNLPPEYPQSSPGQQSWDTLAEATTKAFAGYIGHYHLVREKWDPGWFDFKKYCSELRGEFVFPVFARPPKPDQRAPSIPKQTSVLKEDAELLYRANEQEADGGYYPVGPWGETRVWHGGVHLAKGQGEPVFAPFPGRIVAARMGATSSIGSTNFILMRHQMSLDQELKVEFFSLYMHLADELSRTPRVEWMTRESKDKTGWKDKGKPGAVVLLDEPIEAGAMIGHVGVAGPAELSKGQLHLEIFAQSSLFAGVKNSPWIAADGSDGSRICNDVNITGGPDTNKDGMLSKDELRQYFRSGGGRQLRYFVAQHVSEWIADPSWSDTLRASKDYKSLKPSEIDALVAEQITPGLWWDGTVAKHARLPADGMVYHYNPISFVTWVNEKINEAQNDAASVRPPDAAEARAVPKGITDDREGTDMRSEEEHAEDPCNERLGLKEFVAGYEAPECKP